MIELPGASADATPANIVVENWTEELKQRMPQN